MESASAAVSRIDVSGDIPVVAGSGIKVSVIASEYEHLGMTPDELVQAHPHLSLADVHAALAYYYDQQDEIRAEWQKGQHVITTLRDRYPSRVGRTLQR